jgi:hypothetical protein
MSRNLTITGFIAQFRLTFCGFGRPSDNDEGGSDMPNNKENTDIVKKCRRMRRNFRDHLE